MSRLSKIRKYGVCESIRIAASKYLGITVLKMHFLRLDTDVDDIDIDLGSMGFDVRKLSYVDFLMGDRDVFTPSKLDIYKRRCADMNYSAYGIIENGQLLYSTWISVGCFGLPLIEQHFALNSDEGFLEDSYCTPSARGRGYHTKMNLFRIKKLIELGKSHIIVIVKDGNIPAYKVQMKCGFKDLGIFYVCSLFGIKFTTLNKRKIDKL